MVSQPASNAIGAYPVQQWAHGDPIVHDPHSSLPPLWDAPTHNNHYDICGNNGPPQVQQGTWHGHGPTHNAYQTVRHEDSDDDYTSSSATSSDSDGHVPLAGMPDVTNMTDDDASHAIYLQYRRTKKHWRKFTGRPVRKFRRKFKKWMRRGEGRGRGHGRGQRGNHQRGFMLTWTRSDIDAYVASGPRGSKGFGRRKNPKDRSGNITK